MFIVDQATRWPLTIMVSRRRNARTVTECEGGTNSVCSTSGAVYLFGLTKRTGEANMYPKPLQDLSGWNVRSVGCSVTSIVVAADESVIAWGPSPTQGELVSSGSQIEVLVVV